MEKLLMVMNSNTESFAPSAIGFLLCYIFLGLGLSQLARALGFAKDWLAWIPFGRMFLLGKVADLYTDNRMTPLDERAQPFYTPSKLRRKMLGLGIGLAVNWGAVAFGIVISVIGGIMSFVGTIGGAYDPPAMEEFEVMYGLLALGGLIILAASCAFLVLVIMFITVCCRTLCRIFTALGIPCPALLTAVSVFIPLLAAILIFGYTRHPEELAEKFAAPVEEPIPFSL
jgi:hypothetical protein